MRKSVFNLLLIISVLLGAYYVIAMINSVTLDSPASGFNTTNTSTVTFQCTAIGNGTEVIRNISLGFNYTGIGVGNGSIVINTTQNLSNGTNTSVFTIANLPDGQFLWNCLGANFSARAVTAAQTFDEVKRINNASASTNASVNFSSSNNTIIVDTQRPDNITLVFPSGTTVSQSGPSRLLSNLTSAHFTNGSVTVVWRMHDDGMTSSVCNVTVNGAVRATNIAGYSNTVSGNITELDNSQNTSVSVLGFSSLVTTNTWFVNCTDFVGNANSSNFSGVVTISDTVAPVINNIDQKLKFTGTLNGQKDVEGTKFDFGSPVKILGCNGTDNVDYFSTNATIYIKKPGSSGFSGDLSNDTGGISSFEFTDTRDLGFYNVNCTIRDGSGNQNSTAKTFEILRTAVRGSGAAAIPGFKFTKGKTIVGSDTKNDAGALTTTESSWLFKNGGTVAYLVAGESHSFQVTNIGEGSVTIRVSSTPFDVTINKDETKNVDVNGDGSADVAITLNGFTPNGNADLTFKEVGAGTPADVGPNGEVGGQPTTGPGALAAGNGMWLVVAIIVVVLVVGYFLIKRR